jgi:exopolysaccharide biosynthesis polyprenyl glycosylphosphotransferase
MSEVRLVTAPPADVLPASPGVRAFSIIHRRGPWRDALRRRMLAAADLAGVVAALVVAGAADGAVPAGWLAVAPLWILLAKLHGLYDADHRALRHLTADDFPALIPWSTTSTAMTAGVLAVFGTSVTVTWALALWFAALVFAPSLRAVARWAWRGIVPPERALIVGSGALERATRRKLELFTDIHVRLATGDAPPEELDRIIIAGTAIDEQLIAEHVAICRAHGLKLSIVPPARGMFGTAAQLNHVADLPLIEYSTWDVGRSTLLLKRLIDIGVGAAGILTLAPLALMIALAIRVTSPGPILFVQPRAGRDGRPFRMYKFRTMTVGADEQLAGIVDLAGLSDPMFKLRDDPRRTAFGAWLRRTSLDELPQLLNVVRGDMSLVGPRPEQLDLVDRYAPEHRFRLAVRPGMTGPMQVYGRGELRFDERLAVEREYVENLSLRRDVRILLLTVATVARGRGAF